MLEMSWITAIFQLYSQVADLLGNVIVKRINIRLFDLLCTISLQIVLREFFTSTVFQF